MPEPRELIPPQHTVNLQENVDGLECCYGFVPSNDGILNKKKFKTEDITLTGNNNWYNSADAVARRVVSNKQVIWNSKGDLVLLEPQYRGTLGYNDEIILVEKDTNDLYIRRYKKILVPAYLKIYYMWKNRTNTTTYSEVHNYSAEFDILSQRLYNGVECIGYNGIFSTANKMFKTQGGGYVKVILDKVSNSDDRVQYVLSDGSRYNTGIDVNNDGDSQGYFYKYGRWYSYCAVWDGNSLQPACDSSLGLFMIDYNSSSGKMARFIHGNSTSAGTIPSAPSNSTVMLTPVVYLNSVYYGSTPYYGHSVWYIRKEFTGPPDISSVKSVQFDTNGSIIFNQLSPSSTGNPFEYVENFIPIAVSHSVSGGGWNLRDFLYWRYTLGYTWNLRYYIPGNPIRTLFTCLPPRKIDGSLLFGTNNREMMRPTLMFSYKDSNNGRYHFVYFVKTAQSETSSIMSYYMLDVSFRVASSNDYIYDVELKADLLEDISALGAANVTINGTDVDPSSGYVFIQDFHIPLTEEMLLPRSSSEYDVNKPIELNDVRVLVPSQEVGGDMTISHYASLHGDEFLKIGQKSLQAESISENSRIVVYLDLDNDVHNLNAVSVKIGETNVTYETSMYPYHVIINPKVQNLKKEIKMKALDVYNFNGRIFAINASAPEELMLTVPNSYIFSDLMKFKSEVIDFVPVGNYAYILTKDGVYILFENNDTLMFEKISNLQVYTIGNRDLTSAISILDGMAFVSAEKKLYFARGTIIKELNVNGINYALSKYANTLNLSKIETNNLLLVTPNLYPYWYIGRYSDSISVLSSPEYSTFAIDVTNGTMFNLGLYSKVTRQTDMGTYEDWFFGIGLIGTGRIQEISVNDEFTTIQGIWPSAVVGTQNQYVEDGSPYINVEHRVKEINILVYRIVGDIRLIKIPEKLILMMDSSNEFPPPYEVQDIVAFVDNTRNPSIYNFFNLWNASGNFNPNMFKSNVSYSMNDSDIESFVMRPQGQFQRLYITINPNRKYGSDIKVYGLRAFIVPRTLWY